MRVCGLHHRQARGMPGELFQDQICLEPWAQQVVVHKGNSAHGRRNGYGGRFFGDPDI